MATNIMIRDKVKYAVGIFMMLYSIITIIGAEKYLSNNLIALFFLVVFSVILFISGYVYTIFAR